MIEGQSNHPARVIPARDLFETELSRAYESQQCAAIVCQLVSMKEIGDEYGMPAVDIALNALLRVIVDSSPAGSTVARLKLTIFCILIQEDGSVANTIARNIVRLASNERVEVAKGRTARLRVVAGIAASDEGLGLPPGQLIFEATWRALVVAPYQDGGIASG